MVAAPPTAIAHETGGDASPREATSPIGLVTGSMMAFVGFLAESVGVEAGHPEDGDVGLELERQALCGTWVYGESYEYRVGRTEAGELYFEEPPSADEDKFSSSSKGQQRVFGLLRYAGMWHEGPTCDSTKRLHGRIRMRYVRDSDVVVSNIQLNGHGQWGTDIVAHRRVNQEPCYVPRPAGRETQVEDEKEMEVVVVPDTLGVKMSPRGGTRPQQWGLTRAQCKDLLCRLREEPTWDAGITMADLVDNYVVPWTRGSGLGFALLQNKDMPKEANVLVSHAWSANAEDTLEAILRSTSRHDVLFIAALSLRHGQDTIGELEENPCRQVLNHLQKQCLKGNRCSRCRFCMSMLPAVLTTLALTIFYIPIVAWGCIPNANGKRCAAPRTLVLAGRPRIQWEWLDRYEVWFSEASVLQQVFLAQASLPVAVVCLFAAVVAWLTVWRYIAVNRVLVVPCDECSVFSRLWCVHEVSVAKALRVPVDMAKSLARTGRISSRRAVCQDPVATDRIRKAVAAPAGDKGFDRIDRLLRTIQRRHRWGSLLAFLRLAFLLVVVACADHRLVLSLDDMAAGCDSLGLYGYGVLGVVLGNFLTGLMMFFAARLGTREHRCLAFFFIGSCLVILAGVVVALILLLSDDALLLSLISDDCIGYLGICSSTRRGCLRVTRFYGSLAQTLLLDGCFVSLFLFGARYLPNHWQGRQSVGVMMLLVATASIAYLLHRELGFPSSELAFPFVVFYLTVILSRSVAPIFVLWTCVKGWGVRVQRRQHGPHELSAGPASSAGAHEGKKAAR